ncbi:uncharacterized protein N7483_010438 [Penicillium malachiteum]|uniref:uncharacterized protein n=1 Tax=Penicillium malachiteum TaxID=1324776 RepID=UPI002548F85B|nr:uncharacterized protein N7483_010438 [Penicillium malachiteum]KAJ5713257.1 hypothetical protein N7483_010438 [Penicillium malachiteum]
MSNALFSFVSKRVLGETAKNRFGMEDPYFEEVPASRLGRTFGKKKQKRRKAIPPGLSEHDAKVLTKVKRRAYRLDYSLFNLCGIRFGWGSVIGLVPFIGDAGDAALAMMVVRSCDGIEGGLPSRLRWMMMMNVVIDFVIGLVPFIGDLADAIYKCNTRNAVLLEKHLREKGAKSLSRRNSSRRSSSARRHERGSRREQRVIDHSLPDEFDKQEQESGVVNSSPPTYYDEHGSAGHRNTEDAHPTRPPPTKQARPNRSVTRWFGGASHPQEDPERGL